MTYCVPKTLSAFTVSPVRVLSVQSSSRFTTCLRATQVLQVVILSYTCLKQYTRRTNFTEGIMYRYRRKYALALIFIIVGTYAWSHYHSYPQYEIIRSKKVSEESSDFNIVSLNLSKDVDWSMIKRKAKVTNIDEHSDKWIVVTSVAHPTDQVKKLSAIEGWKLVVVANLKKTPSNWK